MFSVRRRFFLNVDSEVDNSLVTFNMTNCSEIRRSQQMPIYRVVNATVVTVNNLGRWFPVHAYSEGSLFHPTSRYTTVFCMTVGGRDRLARHKTSLWITSKKLGEFNQLGESYQPDFQFTSRCLGREWQK